MQSGAIRSCAAPTLVATVALLACAPALGKAREFSAEAEYVGVAGGPRSTAAVPPRFSAKLYVSDDKARIDFAGLSRHSLIIDDVSQAIVVLLHDRKTYQQLGSRPAEYFRVANADNACPAWQQAVGAPIRCRKSGAELVAGRSTVKYTRPGADGAIDEIWVDRTLRYVVKWRSDGVDMELRKISEGPQPPDLFVVPAGYTPVEPRKLAHRQTRLP